MNYGMMFSDELQKQAASPIIELSKKIKPYRYSKELWGAAYPEMLKAKTPGKLLEVAVDGSVNRIRRIAGNTNLLAASYLQARQGVVPVSSYAGPSFLAF